MRNLLIYMFSYLCISTMTIEYVNAGKFFAGIDATNLNARVKWSQTQPEFRVEPERVKIGYRGDIFGIEFHAYPDTETLGSSNNYNFNLKLNDMYGAYLRLQDEWLYARIGMTWVSTEFTWIDAQRTNIDFNGMPTLAVGLDWQVSIVSFNLDYTYMEHTLVLPDITATGPGLTNPPLVYQGFALGVNISF